jgi:HEPN domain-containing protein
MQPTTSRDFQKASLQRRAAAESLLQSKHNLDAQYLGGYAVECSLKALILEKTAATLRPAKLKKITAGATMHRLEVLLGELKGLRIKLPPKLAGRFRRLKWDTNLRYEIGRRDTGETAAFLKTAKAIYHWVEGQMP